MGEKKTAFCEKCNKDVKIRARVRQERREANGSSYVFRRQVAVCSKCGSELLYQEYDIAADQEFQRAVDTSSGIVTPEQVAEIPRRYAIGKRPLSRLLGWGELTYTRLLEGRSPTQEHSDELRRILNDPAAYGRLLEQGRRQGVITELAYQRSRRALDTLLTEEHHDSTALFAVADRFCVLAEGDLTPRALQALVYFAQGYSCAKGDEPLFDTLPLASDFGPEYEQIRDGYTFANIQDTFESTRASDSAPSASSDSPDSPDSPDSSASSASPAPSASPLDDAAESIVASVYQKYGIYSGGELCRLARSQAPWRKARKRDDDRISLKSLRKFFSKNL